MNPSSEEELRDGSGLDVSTEMGISAQCLEHDENIKPRQSISGFSKTLTLILHYATISTPTLEA